MGCLSVGWRVWIVAELAIEGSSRVHQLTFKWCPHLLHTELAVHRRRRMHHLRLDRRAWVLAHLAVEWGTRMHNGRWLVGRMPQVTSTAAQLTIAWCPRLPQLTVNYRLRPGRWLTIASDQTVTHVRQRAQKVGRTQRRKARTCTLDTIVVS